MKAMMQSMKRRLGSSDAKNGSRKNSAKTRAPGDLPSPTGANGNEAKTGAAAYDGRGSDSSNDNMPDAVRNPFLEHIPSFKEVPVSERQQLFIRKLRACCFEFNWNELNISDVRAKEQKRQALLELVDYISNYKSPFPEPVLQEIVDMISANIFRALPQTSAAENYDPEEDEPVLEPAWPHLQIVYEFLLRFVVSTETDPKLLKKYIDSTFILRLLELFDSEDPRERDYLKTILHRIYGKFMPLRAFIRRSINNVFYKFIYETERHNGVAELLEILGSIINGFALPLKEEHKVFLQRVLIPLHKPKILSIYHPQLSYCVTQFVEKDPKLAVPVINGILKFWPVTNSKKETLFLSGLEEVLELTQPEEFKTVMVNLCRQLAKSINSPHFQVAERAILLLNNDHVLGLIADSREVLFPVMYPAVQNSANSHWNATVHQLTQNVMKMFMEMDPQLFDQVSNTHLQEEEERRKRVLARDRSWQRFSSTAPANIVS